MFWSDLREEEFEGAIEKSGGVCVIPVGCLEKHGQHLPVGTDTILAERTIARAAEEEPIVIFPPYWFGDIQGLYDHKGSVILSSELMFAMFKEFCDEIGRNGFKKIVLFNSHGGNDGLIRYFVKSTLHTKKDYVVFGLEAAFPRPPEILDAYDSGKLTTKLSESDIALLHEYSESDKEFGHACFIETGWLMDLAPELARLDRADAESGLSTHRMDKIVDAKLYTLLSWFGNRPNSYAGSSPACCTRTIGAAITEFIVDDAVEKIRTIKEDTEALKVNAELGTPVK